MIEETGNILDNIGIVLDRTRHAGNIGSVSRLMKNLGFNHLHLVNPTEYMHISALRMARGTEEMIEKASLHGTLTEAVSGYHLSFATSHRMKQDTAMSLAEGAKKIVSTARNNKVAILFGSEKYGLSKEDTEKANGVITLPVEQEFPSVNLAQSVGMVALQVKLEAIGTKTNVPNQIDNASIHLTKEKSKMFIDEFLSLAGIVGFEMPSIELKIREVLERTNLTEAEFNLFYGLVRMVKKKVTGREDGRKY